MSELGGVFPAFSQLVFEKIEDVFGLQPKRKRKTPSRKCALPGCENMTRHRGGYCCADHKNMHKNMHKHTALVDVL